MMKNSNFNPPNMNKINPNVNYNQIPYKIPNFGRMDFQQMMNFKRESKYMERIIWLFSIPGRIKKFMCF